MRGHDDDRRPVAGLEQGVAQTASGRLIAVVGPSGVGKDSVMEGVLAGWPGLVRVRRVITRAPDLGGEDYDAVSVAQFETMATEGAFCVHWDAHGLFYGLPSGVLDRVREGTDCLANFSRGALPRAAEIFPAMTVLQITARPETLARRLAARGRETGAEIARRLERAAQPLPEGLDVVTVSNDGALGETVAEALRLLQPVRA
jgi:ribose 1,5-bisphosphokinase